MLQDLIDAVYEATDDGATDDCRIVAVHHQEAELLIELSIVTNGFSSRDRGDSGANVSRWQLKCVDVVDFGLSSASVGCIECHDSHVRLWPFTTQRMELYARGSEADPMRTLGALAMAHLMLVGSAFPLPTFLNDHFFHRALSMLREDHFLLAAGPAPIMKAYGQALDSCGISNYSLERGHADWFSRAEGGDGPGTLAVLSLDDSYVVARDFVVRRL